MGCYGGYAMWRSVLGKRAIFEDYFPKLFNFAEFHAITAVFDSGDTVVVTGRYEIIQTK
ncbi:MAG: hypothetical protein QW652_03625 [Candidatus Nitrosotenuis sp.]